MTHLEWLRRPTRKRSLKTVRELFSKYYWLEQHVGHGPRLPTPKVALSIQHAAALVIAYWAVASGSPGGIRQPYPCMARPIRAGR